MHTLQERMFTELSSDCYFNRRCFFVYYLLFFISGVSCGFLAFQGGRLGVLLGDSMWPLVGEGIINLHCVYPRI